MNMVRLGDVAQFINGDRGRNYPSGKDFVSKGIPFINAGHLDASTVDFTSMNYITPEKFELLGSGKLQANDILYCLRGSLGKSAIFKTSSKAAIASSLLIIRPHKNCYVDYLYYFLTSPLGRQEIIRFNNGSAQPNLSATSVKEYKLPFPPLPEQKRIAAILDKADAIRRKRQETLTLTENLIQSTFLDMFATRNYPTKTIGEFCSVKGGKRLPKGSPYADHPTEHPYIRVVDFHNMSVKDDDLKYITPETHEKISRYTISSQDLYISIAGTIGLAGVVPQKLSGANLTENAAKILINENVITNSFLSNFLNSGLGQKQIRSKTMTTSQPKLALFRIEEIEVPIPPIKAQQEFDRFAAKAFEAKPQIEAALEESNNLFNSLQQRAFSGELSNN